jgi:hypothetical protein
MTATITISGKSLGKKKPLFADWSIPFPPEWDDGDGLTLRELITRIVLAEVAAFRDRQEQRRVARVLSAADIDEGLTIGKVDSGGRDLQQSVDDDEAVGTALEAFEDGLYLVIIDGTEHRDLDAQVYLQPDSRVTFVRLTFLAGA